MSIDTELNVLRSRYIAGIGPAFRVERGLNGEMTFEPVRSIEVIPDNLDINPVNPEGEIIPQTAIPVLNVEAIEQK